MENATYTGKPMEAYSDEELGLALDGFMKAHSDLKTRGGTEDEILEKFE